MNKRKLWNRKLSCGHERLTGIDYYFGESKQKEPKKGEDCYCRECNENVKIVEVGEVLVE